MYRLRFIKTILLGLLSRSHKLMDEFHLYFWAIPFVDTDFTRLFTQSYSIFMGLGRWHFVFNSEFRTVALKRAWVPVTTAETIIYKKSIKAFSKVKLRTRLIYWNDRRFYLEQSFYVNDELHAQAFIEGLIRSTQGHLKPIEVFHHLGVNQESPKLTKSLQLWISSRTDH